MRILPTGLAALALAGCHSPAPAGNGTMPNEAQVEAEFENQQDALAASIENDANADDATNAENGVFDGRTTYSCGKNLTVTIEYGDGIASLITGGKTIVMKSVPNDEPFTPDSKYHSDTGLSPGKTVTWIAKSPAGMLVQAPRGAKKGVGETTLYCFDTAIDR